MYHKQSSNDSKYCFDIMLNADCLSIRKEFQSSCFTEDLIGIKYKD
jgi:hypothetical protein